MYKIINNDKVIDIVLDPKFIRFLSTGHITLTDKSSAQGILGSDDHTIYSFMPIVGKNYTVVTVTKITSKEEFSRLSSLLNSGEIISADESALAKAKRSKINILSTICKNIIISGFSIVLSDGLVSDFKLTTEDQLNLTLIENRLAAGDTTFIYHATNQPCKIYSREDMLKIINSFRQHVLYHTTYFNIAKQYIKTLVDIEKVNLFTYGDSLLDFETDPILKQILKNGGIN